MSDEARSEERDACIYPESDHMGESMIQRLIAELLRPLLARFLAERGEVAFVGADQFFYWKRGDATQRVAPDVYVVPGQASEQAPASWLLWQHERGPSFALEVVGRDAAKDYEDAPSLYKSLGVDELVIFDPEPERRSDGVRWQVWRTVKRRGFVRVYASNADRAECASLGCWLRCVGEGAALRVRIATGPLGDELFATELEREQRERAEKERVTAERDALLRELDALRSERGKQS
ncbi:MAG: Uma2 family endonuclease [Polyangiales bacterium]